MSFFKKLTSDFKSLSTKDEKNEASHDRGAADSYYASHDQQYPPQQSSYGHGQQYPPQQPSYGHEQQYPPQQPSYGHENYQSHSTGYGAPSHSGPQLPAGWEARFDPTSNRQYFVTIVSQWEPPSLASSMPAPSASYFMPPPGSFVPQAGGAHGERGLFGGGGHGYGGGYGEHGRSEGYGSHDPHGHGGAPHEDDGNKKMMLGAAGGLAVGAVGGAIIEMTEDEHGNPVQVTQTYPPPSQTEGYGEEPLPTTDAEGDSVSGSDHEDVEEAREDLREAEREGSQSDIEEAREEYQEEYEETYED